MTDAFAPKQQRSRKTVERLLEATIKTLERHGLEGATIPRIAAAAGVAPASVYRRFADRDALFRAALMDALEAGVLGGSSATGLASLQDLTLEEVAARLVAATLQQYRAQPGLMRALTRFVETDPDEDFRRKALRLVAANFAALAEGLLVFRDQIDHPNPRRAITFALLNMATVVEVNALEQVSMWRELMPLSDRNLRAELTRTFVAYLRSGPR
jgi:AcrR family transcriptional regulator